MSSKHSRIPFSTAIGDHMCVTFYRNSQGAEQWTVAVQGISPEDCADRLIGQLKRDVFANCGIKEEHAIKKYYDSGDHEAVMRRRAEIGYELHFDPNVKHRYFPNAKSEIGRLAVSEHRPEGH